MSLSQELFDSLPSNGWLTFPEACLLWESAKNTEGDILEIGTYYGRSTVLLASLSIGRGVYSVDPFDGFDDTYSGDEIEKQFLLNLESRGIYNVVHYRQRIEDWIVEPVGFAYLDGDHSYQGTLNQIVAARESGATSVCLHDYATSGGGREVKRAIEDFPLKVLSIVERMAHCVFNNQ